MRVYLPWTVEALAEVAAAGQVRTRTAHAVTPALREWYAEGDAEELEYAALLEAAEASLRMLAPGLDALDGRGGVARRLVLAADVDGAVPAGGPPEAPRSLVVLDGPVPLARVVSLHVDDAEAADDVRAAAAALPAADAGDEDARFVVDGADGHDLLWYDVTELPDVAALR